MGTAQATFTGAGVGAGGSSNSSAGLGGARGLSHGCHLLAVGAVQAGRLAARKAAHQAELTAMMDAVREDRARQNVAYRHRAQKKRNLTVEILRRELADPRDGLAMDPFESRRQFFDGTRALDIGRLRAHREVARSMP